MRVVLDTNVIVSALRSRSGVSFALLSALEEGRFEIALTLPLYLEYRDVLGRDGMVDPSPDADDIVDICRGLADLAHLQYVYYLWRPLVKDPRDDLVLEAALASGSRYIVTHNTRDFAGRRIEKGLGVEIVTPKSFLEILYGWRVNEQSDGQTSGVAARHAEGVGEGGRYFNKSVHGARGGGENVGPGNGGLLEEGSSKR